MYVIQDKSIKKKGENILFQNNTSIKLNTVPEFQRTDTLLINGVNKINNVH